MSTDEDVVQAHSVAEAYLYLKVARCQACDQGPLNQTDDLTKTQSAPGGWSLKTRCGGCGRTDRLCFSITPTPTREGAESGVINPTRQRSQAIDLLGWLTLFQAILEASAKETNKESARQLACEAGLCLDEAMKFYTAKKELPSEDAFYSEEARRRFRDHPQQFAQSKWRERRLRLPDARAKTWSADVPTRRRWWQFWRRKPRR